jgi:hypothetical protein
MHGHITFVYTRQMKQDKAPTEAIFTFIIYYANKQGTHATCIYHQHAKHKQTSVSSAPTHAHIQITMHAFKLGTDHHARLGTVHLHAKYLLATRRTVQASDHSDAIGGKQASGTSLLPGL